MINLLRMNKKISLLLLIGLVLIPQLVLADIMTPISQTSLPLFSTITLIEAFVFWLFINKIFKVKVGFWKSLLIIFVANIITSLIGTFIPYVPFGHHASTVESTDYILPSAPLIVQLIFPFIAWGLYFVLSVFIEWAVYIQFLKKTIAKKSDLLKISFVANFVTYALLILMELLPFLRY